MDVTVCVGTFGDQSWWKLAEQRAVLSVPLDIPLVHVHAGTLHGARNGALASVETEFVCFLDADDELEPLYFTHMGLATADLRAPAVSYVKDGTAYRPEVPHVAGHAHTCRPKCLAYGNWLVIGTVARTDIVRAVGGFRDFAVYEDYDLWVRCWQAGATIEAVPDAVYRAYVRPDSRNRGSLQRAEKHAVHQAIARANGLEVPA